MVMKKQQIVDFTVGLFMIAGVMAFAALAINVSGLSDFSSSGGYHVSAEFADIGGLKIRAPVTIAGVKIGEVSDIELQPEDLNAKVTMTLQKRRKIPYEDSSARILTEGLLGSNYISIVPGFEDADPEHPYLKEGDVIAKTQEAIILENLIGQLLFNINKK
jgi:phospholipid/cholesterol/gamma-HCH transport system substrate-binding protein